MHLMSENGLRRRLGSLSSNWAGLRLVGLLNRCKRGPAKFAAGA
jgi:hypothetical protein